MTAAFPAKSACSITVTRTDGTTETASRDYPHGAPADPLSDAEIEDKLRTYFFFAEGDEASKVIDRLLHLDQQPNLNDVVAPLKRRRI